MSLALANRARARPTGRPHRPNLRAGARRRRAVSDVVATILILGLTVTLFASIFAFVGSFPQPPPQNISQFQGTLQHSANGTYITGVTIEHLTGPAIPAYDKVYLESATTVTEWQFGRSGGIPVYWGLTGNSSSNVWNYGSSWSTTFKTEIRTPDNISVYIVSSTQLLYSATLPGLAITFPPAIVAAGITPTTLTIGESFKVWASLGGTLTGITAKVNLNSVTGLSGNDSLLQAASGLYTYSSSAGPTASGTFYAYIYVTNTLGQIASTTIPIVVASTGSTTGSLSVATGISTPPQPSSTSIWVPGAAEYFWGTVTYTGKSTGNLYVNFTVAQTVVVNGHTDTASATIAGPSGLTITGPTSETVYSPTGYYLWLIGSTQASKAAPSVFGASVTVTANAVVTSGIGKASGTTTFTPSTPTPAPPTGLSYISTSTTTPYSSIEASFSHSCTTSTCPYLYYSLWDNYSAGPSSVTVAGTLTVYGNFTVSTTHVKTAYTKAYTISSTTLTEGTPQSINAVGGTTRFVPSTILGISSSSTGSGTFVLVLYLTISDGGTPVEYLYQTFSFSMT